MSTRQNRLILRLSSFLLLGVMAAGLSQAQPLQPRYGLGFNTMLSSVDGVGIGLGGRLSVPVNTDLSIGADLGFTGFIFTGRRDATWVFMPQLSAIITLLPEGRGATYILAGIGAYAPVSNQDESEAGPTLNLGIGRVRVLRETTIFYEINPALIVGLDAVNLALPIRAGIIF